MKKHILNLNDFLQSNWLLRHLLFWTLIVVYFVLGGMPGDWNKWSYVIAKSRFQGVMLFIPGWVLAVYPLLYFLIPKYLLRKKYLAFFSGAVLLFVFVLFVVDNIVKSDLTQFKSGTVTSWKLSSNLLPLIHVCGIAASVKLIKYFFVEESRAIHALQQKTYAELELLKAQIHPHFLFNTLNNLYAHTINNSEKSPEIVLKLSELLRFMIYESCSEKILLQQEIALLKNYIDLEKLRYGDNLEISTTLDGNYHGKYIAPLLLLPLVENSFKHGVSTQTGKSWITLNIDVQGAIFHFKLINSKDPDGVDDIGHEQKGVGMNNVRKRLDLLYPGKHNFQISSGEDFFMVSMSLELALYNEIELTNIPKSATHDLELSIG